MPSLVTERIESVKAGILGAASFALAESTIIAISILAANFVREYNLNQTIVVDWQLWIQLAIGAVSGFLFGVTYRYVIRNDRNSHLNDGAVLAFGLVRGLALVESNFTLSALLASLFLIIQSVICFAISRSLLDFALARKLIKPFI